MIWLSPSSLSAHASCRGSCPSVGRLCRLLALLACGWLLPLAPASHAWAGEQDGESSEDVSISGDDDATSPDPDDPTAEYHLRFSFEQAPWADVIEWFVDQTDFALQMDEPPAGSFNYTDPRLYSPREALDLINGELLLKGYAMIRRASCSMSSISRTGYRP